MEHGRDCLIACRECELAELLVEIWPVASWKQKSSYPFENTVLYEKNSSRSLLESQLTPTPLAFSSSSRQTTRAQSPGLHSRHTPTPNLESSQHPCILSRLPRQAQPPSNNQASIRCPRPRHHLQASWRRRPSLWRSSRRPTRR